MPLNIISTAATGRTCVKYIQIEMRGKYKTFPTIRNSINYIKDRLQEKKLRISGYMGNDNSPPPPEIITNGTMLNPKPAFCRINKDTIHLNTNRYWRFRDILKTQSTEWKTMLHGINNQHGTVVWATSISDENEDSKPTLTCIRHRLYTELYTECYILIKVWSRQDCSACEEPSTQAWLLSFHPGTPIKVEGETQLNKVVLWPQCG